MQGDDAIDDEKVQVVVRPGLKEPKLPTGRLEFCYPVIAKLLQLQWAAEIECPRKLLHSYR